MDNFKIEIRAVEKLKLAQAVRDQKKEECLILAEALLDDEIKIGELLKNIPTAQGTRSDLTSVHRWTEVGNASNHTCENLSLPQKTKSQIVKKFNFTIASLFLFTKLFPGVVPHFLHFKSYAELISLHTLHE
ncbi:hypothetical protein [Petroclostridium sp. X23]|uniref:hypothetical protein n=1 Tax=Petroclostridium sp. X23 TaxID=3045146 RepID=UPI0024AE3D2F|nr:hypothetical protein [Petroclostridium sp. X23]WHH59314.1 hypothetical protein QKW49_00660 [Petroclostridium sp. X23]